MLRIVRTTLLGGVTFLIPLVVLLVVAGTALDWVRRLTDPVARTFPPSFGDRVILANTLAVLVLIVVCFFAGLVAHTAVARRLVDVLEDQILNRIPFYAVLKTKADALLRADEAGALLPVMLRFDDSWQLGFEVERVDGEYVAVFVPGAPDPWAGSVLIMEADRVSPLDLSIPIVERLCHRLGHGADEALRRHFREARA
ncbi:MAG: DUF502 domain-containing protein [Gemmatimonadota bacterium]